MAPRKKQKKLEPDGISIEYLITKEFHTTEEFSTYVEQFSKKRNIGIIEFLLEYCEVRDIDPISIASILTSSLKEKIEMEALKLSLLEES